MVKVIKHKFLISFIVLLFVSVASLFVFSSKAATVSAADDDLFVMDHGASICLTQDGLRFRVRMGKNVYDRITTNDDGDKVRLAFLIAPSYLFDAAESEDYYNSLSKKVVVNISDESKIYQVGLEYWANGCIGDLASESLSVKQMDYVFSAIACIIDNTTATTTYTYADFAGGSRENNTRSQYYVINAAALDPNHDYTERLISTDEETNPYAGWYGTSSYPIKIDTDAQYTGFVSLIDDKSIDFGTRNIAVKDTVDTTETPSSAPVNVFTTHEVNFYDGAEVVKSYTVKDGEDVVAPADPASYRSGDYSYAFKRWKDGEENNAVFTDITESVDFYADYYTHFSYAMAYVPASDTYVTAPATAAQMSQNSFIRYGTQVTGDFSITSTITATQEYWGKVGYAIEDKDGKVAMFMLHAKGFAYRYGTNIRSYSTFNGGATHSGSQFWDYRVSGVFTGSITDHYISSANSNFTVSYSGGTISCLINGVVKHEFSLSTQIGALDTTNALNVYFVTYQYKDAGDTDPARTATEPHFVFNSVNVSDSAAAIYTINYVDYDSSAISSTKVAYGVTPSAPTPTSEVTYNGLTYKYTGWTTPIVAATENTTYTAQRAYVASGIDYNTTTGKVETTTPDGHNLSNNTYIKLPYTAAYANGFVISADIEANEVYWPLVGFELADSNNRGLLVTIDRTKITFVSVTAALTATGNATKSYTAIGLQDVGTMSGTNNCNVAYASFNLTLKFSEGTFYVFVDDVLYLTKNISALNTDFSRTVLNAAGSYSFYLAAWRPEDPRDKQGGSYLERTSGKPYYAWDNVAFENSFEPADYTITWKDGNGSTLATDTVALGEVPVYTGSTPTKASTAQYDYTFSGWTTTPVMAYADTTYTAQFESAVREYTITFNDFDDSLIEEQSVAYGSTPTPPTMDIVAYNGLAYVFQSWDVTPVAVTGDATYTAVRDYDAQGFAYNGTTGNVESTLHTTGLHLNYNDNYAMLPYEADPDDGFVIKTTIRAQQVHFPASGIMIVDYSNPSAAKKPGFAITVGKGRFLFYHLTDYTTHSGYTSKEDGSSVFYAPMGFNDYGTRLADYDKNYANNTQAKDSPYDSTATLEIRFCNDTLYAFANESLIWSITLSELNSAWGKTVLDPDATSLRFCLFSYRVEDWKTASSTYYTRTAGTPHITFSDITFADSCTVLSSPEVAAKYADGVGYTPIVENISLPVADASNPEKTVYSISAVINASTSTLSNGQYCGIMLNTHGATTNTVRLIVRNDSGTIKYHVYYNGTDLTYGGMPSTASPRHELSIQITSKGKIAVYVDGSRRKNDVYTGYGSSVPMTADLSVLSNVETVGSSSALVLYYSTYERP